MTISGVKKSRGGIYMEMFGQLGQLRSAKIPLTTLRGTTATKWLAGGVTPEGVLALRVAFSGIRVAAGRPLPRGVGTGR